MNDMIDVKNIADLNIVVGKENHLLEPFIDDNHIFNYAFYETRNLHYSEVLNELEHFASLTDTGKIFLKTHSLDVIRSLPELIDNHPEITIQLIHVGRSARTSNKGELLTVIYDAERIKELVEQDIEMR